MTVAPTHILQRPAQLLENAALTGKKVVVDILFVAHLSVGLWLLHSPV